MLSSPLLTLIGAVPQSVMKSLLKGVGCAEEPILIIR